MTPEQLKTIKEALEKSRPHVSSDRNRSILDMASKWERNADEALASIDNALAILATIEGDQPTDPDAHITDIDAYLEAKRERAKETDFDAIEGEGAEPCQTNSPKCLTPPQPAKVDIERIMEAFDLSGEDFLGAEIMGDATPTRRNLFLRRLTNLFQKQ
jgi:hypothetical protein